MQLTNLSTTPKILRRDDTGTWRDLVGMLFLVAACWLVMALTDGMDSTTPSAVDAPITQQATPWSSIATWVFW